MDGNLTATTLDVSGMDCAGCARKIDRALREIAGVRDVSLHYPETMLGVLHDDHVSEGALRAAVERLGFQIGATSGL